MLLHKNRWSVAALASLFAGLLCIVAVASSRQDDGQKKEPTKDAAFESKEPLPEKTIPPVPFWESDRGFETRAAMHVFAPGRPWHVLATRILASEHKPELEGWTFEFDEVLPIYGRYLQLLEDGRELPVRDSRKPKQLSDSDKAMLLAYNQAIDRSHAATMAMFEKSALKFNYVKYSHLKTRPAEYRGKIVTVEGRLKVIRKHEAPPYLRDPLIKHIYTGWVVGPHKTLPPFTIAFTELPTDMRVSETLDFPVNFIGYFIGLVKFPPDTPKQKEVISPYVIGKTFTLVDAKKIGEIKDEDTDKTSYAYHYIIWTLGAIILVATLIASMNIWFRRGDDAVKSRLAEVREKSQPFQLEDETTPPPVEPPTGTPPPP
ncbi:MAG: hypothetical protein EXS16_04950 [Gemmataceae bacterium]|nr:hypothetical protein [Gemmataceae bacterium]